MASNDQLVNLNALVVKLTEENGNIAKLRQTKEQTLDRELQHHPIASQPKFASVMRQNVDIIHREFEIVDFLRSAKRSDTFQRLSDQIERLSNRTLIIRKCTTNGTFSRELFDKLTAKKRDIFSDIAHLTAQAHHYDSIIKSLLCILNSAI